MSDSTSRKYTTEDITIIWQPTVCIHSTICWRNATGLPTVFNPKERPWIKPENESTEKIMAQIDKCPSGALSYIKNNTTNKTETILSESIIEPQPNGPLLAYGNITVKTADGKITKKNKVTAFCRCGASQNKPYCDGTHTKINFKG